MCKSPDDCIFLSYVYIIRIYLRYVYTYILGPGKPWSIRGNNLREMDKFISKIKFPVDFQRRIPSLENNLSYFKASEYKNLLLYGLIPALIEFILKHDITDPDVIDFCHWVAIYNEIAVCLNADIIGLSKLPSIDRLIDLWQESLPEFLGEENQTYNAHATCHLTHFVKQLGPLQNYTTFSFESFNEVYAKMVTSAHGKLEQVSKRFAQEKYIRSWRHKAEQNKELGEFIEDALGKSSTNFVTNSRYGSVKLLSKCNATTLDAVEVSALELALGVQMQNVVCATSAKVGSTTVRSQSFEKNKNTCTYVGKFNEKEASYYAIICRIFLYDEQVFALCKELKSVGSLIDKIPRCSRDSLYELWNDSGNFHVPYGNNFRIVEPSSVYRVARLDSLSKRCILVDVRDYTVLMEECMSFEHN